MAKVNMNEMVNSVTINVKILGMGRFKFKLWIAKQLFKLAGKITGMNIKFENEPYQKPDI